MKLNCHCGAVEAEINATVNELAKIVRCNCSICKRKNATMGMVKNEDFKVTKGEDNLKLYQYQLNVLQSFQNIFQNTHDTISNYFDHNIGHNNL